MKTSTWLAGYIGSGNVEKSREAAGYERIMVSGSKTYNVPVACLLSVGSGLAGKASKG